VKLISRSSKLLHILPPSQLPRLLIPSMVPCVQSTLITHSIHMKVPLTSSWTAESQNRCHWAPIRCCYVVHNSEIRLGYMALQSSRDMKQSLCGMPREYHIFSSVIALMCLQRRPYQANRGRKRGKRSNSLLVYPAPGPFPRLDHRQQHTNMVLLSFAMVPL
jgi:hypothetical protein